MTCIGELRIETTQWYDYLIAMPTAAIEKRLVFP